ncbi:MAG: RnfABCDGE type electron transport complex subunit B [Brevinema sp.]
MDFTIVLMGTAVLCITAFILGLTISLVTQLFYIKVDPRIAQIYEILPHFNCGACGRPGCMPYAESVINENLEPNRCKPGKEAVAEKIIAILNQ